MYTINKADDYLLVQLNQEFDATTIRTIIHHETMLEEFAATNDIWLIGNHPAHIRLGELDALVSAYVNHCPDETTRTKTAIVSELGLTQAILDLWMTAVRKRVSFDLKLFKTRAEAEAWISQAIPQEARVA